MAPQRVGQTTEYKAAAMLKQYDKRDGNEPPTEPPALKNGEQHD